MLHVTNGDGVKEQNSEIYLMKKITKQSWIIKVLQITVYHSHVGVCTFVSSKLK